VKGENMTKAVYKTKEVADLLGVSTDYIYGLVKKNNIPHVRVGTRIIRYPITSIHEWMNNNDEVSKELSLLTEKERKALKEAVLVLYLADSSDYINGLWDVVRAIIGEKVEEESFSLEKVLNLLDPELGKGE